MKKEQRRNTETETATGGGKNLHRCELKNFKGKRKAMQTFTLAWLYYGGLYWTRTSDPIDVNDVLYQLSQQTTCTRRFIRRQEIVYHTFAPLSRGVEQVFDFFRGAMSVLATGKRAAGSPGGACCW